MTIGRTDNKTSRDINDALYQRYRRGPSEKQNHLWYKEYLDSGAQFLMSYSVFRITKLKEFNKKFRFKKKK